MVTKAPAYLTVRNGIFYFQLRIPAHITHSSVPSSRIIRKSTGTGNFREALRISRQWWNLIMAGDFFEETYPEVAKSEQTDAMVRHGEHIYRQFKIVGVDENDHLAMEDFFKQYSAMSRVTDTGRVIPSDMECFYAAKEYYEGLQRTKDESIPVTVDTVPQSAPQLSPIAPNSTIKPSTLRLKDVLDRYIQHKTTVITDKKGWSSEGSRKKIVPNIEIMIEMVGNPLAHEYSLEMLRDLYKPRIMGLPDRVNLRGVFKGRDENGKLIGERKSIDECFEIADEQDIKRLHPNTIVDYVNNAVAFLVWAADEKYIVPNTENILEDLKGIGEEDERRHGFNSDELITLFETEDYQKGLLFKKPYRHWVPLISLYTGCRAGEASQLFVDDIQKTDKNWSNGESVWVFRFTNEGEGQTIKGKGKKIRKRFVPIHQDLVKLGLLVYWQKIKSKSETLLFPELLSKKERENGIKSKEWSRSISRWFNGETSNSKRVIGYKEKYGVVTDEKRVMNFHSFRHYISNRSKQNTDWNYNIWCEFTGHSTGSTVRKKTYEDDFDLDLKVKEMEKMKMDFLDVESIKKWE